MHPTPIPAQTRFDSGEGSSGLRPECDSRLPDSGRGCPVVALPPAIEITPDTGILVAMSKEGVLRLAAVRRQPDRNPPKEV